MLKKFTFAVTMLYASAVSAQTERECLNAGEMAKAVAEMLESGQSEEFVIGLHTDPPGNYSTITKIRRKIRTAAELDVVRYVFTVRPTPAEARVSVYKKCMAGGLGHVDWSKHPEARDPR